MAQVAADPHLRTKIDEYLDYVIRAWRGIPDVAAQWDQWDDISQLTFVVDWGVPSDRLHQLHRWAEQGCLTPAQRAQYEELLRLVAQHHATLERLLAD